MTNIESSMEIVGIKLREIAEKVIINDKHMPYDQR